MNINKIRLSGQTYNIQDLNATKTVELTQAEYDALSPKDPNVFYIITDAEAGDLSNYYTKTETSGATEISTALASKADTATTYTKTETDNAITAATSTKQDTLVSGTNIKTINNQSILGEGNITIEGGSGGGKAISGGTNISITTGDTSDTINCTLPITADTNTNAPKIKIDSNYSLLTSNSSVSQYDENKAYSNILFGKNNTISNSEGYGGNLSCNFLLGEENSAKNDNIYKPTSSYNMLCGTINTTNNSYGFALGGYNTFSKDYQFAVGLYHKPKNEYETSFGKYSISVSASGTFGDGGNTLFSLGNGTSNNARHNAFEIRQNGDIYIADTNDTSTTNYYEKPMIKLQDALGGGGGGSSYTAGDGIDITNDVISVTGKVDTSAFTAHTADTVIHVTSDEKAAWNAKSDFSGDYNDLANKPTIPTVPTSNTAFTNDAGYITSDALNGYATTGDVQTATADMATKTWVGQQGYLTEHQSLSNYYTKSETSGATEISTALNAKADTATTYTKTEVDTELASKQDTLVSGTNIKTINNESILGSGNITIQGGGSVDQTIISGSTNAVAGGAVYTQLDGLKLKKITQSAYDALSPNYDANTLYVING